MALYVECGEASGPSLPVEIGNPVWVETVAAGAASTNAVPANGRSYVISVTSSEDGFIIFGALPNAASGNRRRVVAGVVRSFAVGPGDRIAFATT